MIFVMLPPVQAKVFFGGGGGGLFASRLRYVRCRGSKGQNLLELELPLFPPRDPESASRGEAEAYSVDLLVGVGDEGRHVAAA